MKKVLYLALIMLAVCGIFTACNRKNESSDDTWESEGTTYEDKNEETDNITGTDLIFDGATQINTEEFGTILYYKVKYDKIVISFSDYIRVEKSSKWSVSSDIYGRLNIPSKTAGLSEGSNLFYILVTDSQERSKQYIVLIERAERITWTVSFLENGHVVSHQQVDDGKYAYEPTYTPTRTGYRFVKWDYDFSQPVTKDLEIDSVWEKCCLVDIYFSFQTEQGIESYSLKQVTINNGTAIKDVLTTDELLWNAAVGNYLLNEKIATTEKAEKYLLRLFGNAESVSFSHYMLRENSSVASEPTSARRAEGKEKLNCFEGELYYVFNVQLRETSKSKVKIIFQYHFSNGLSYPQAICEIAVEPGTSIGELLQLPEAPVTSGASAKRFVMELLTENDEEDDEKFYIHDIIFQGYLTGHSFLDDSDNQFEKVLSATDESATITAPFHELYFIFDIDGTHDEADENEICPVCGGVLYWEKVWKCRICGNEIEFKDEDDE